MEEFRRSIEDATTSFEAAIERGLGVERRGAIEKEENGVEARDASPKRGKLLLGVANVGGSLTILLQIALVAWGIRRLRSMLDNRRQRIDAEGAAAAAAASSSSSSAAASERDAETAALPSPSSASSSSSSSSLSSRPVDQVLFAFLSPVAVKRLVELDPVQYAFVDVRFLAAVKDSPAPFEAVLHIPESELSGSLQLSKAEWEGRYPSVRKIGQGELIVFLSTKGRRAQRAANVAADLGYSGCCILSGGLEAYAAAMSTYVDVPLKFLSRDAVATILEKQQKSEESTEARSSSVHLLDVRRPDERAQFGHINGSQNIPVTELPKALTLDEVAWEKSYHFPKFTEADTLIFQCRINGRAAWGAQLAQDAGLKQCFVYKEGALGWRLDPSIKPYNAYKSDDTAPDPIQFEVEKVNHDAARRELEQVGLR